MTVAPPGAGSPDGVMSHPAGVNA